jgi:hypothetical protein
MTINTYARINILTKRVDKVEKGEESYFSSLPDYDLWIPDNETRPMYAGIGYHYDVEKDIFYTPSPYPSWILNTETCTWQPPVAEPVGDDTTNYVWNEDNQTWDAITVTSGL